MQLQAAMRFYEWLTLAYLLFFSILGCLRPLPRDRRAAIIICGLTGILAVIFLRTGLLRDWLPVLFIPLTYYQTGRFVRPLHHRLQSTLAAMDRRFLAPLPKPIMFAFEAAYLLCYPFVPAGLIALYLSGNSQFATEFWNVVLPPAYLCYATFPFLQTLPPRALENPGARRTRMRNINAFVLKHISTEANTFPSGHVAAAIAVALVVLEHAFPAGVAFLAGALCIAAGAFFGRYHYLVDVTTGAFLAALAFVFFGRG